MKNQLKKLASLVLQYEKDRKQAHTVKCAQTVQALVGLELLRKRIGGK